MSWSRLLLLPLFLAPATVQARPAAPPARVDGSGDALPDGAGARLGSLRWRHDGAVFFVGFTPDGKEVVTASQPHLRCTVCHADPFKAPDEMPPACNERTFRVFQSASGIPIRSFGEVHKVVPLTSLRGNGGRVLARGRLVPALLVALAPDGKTLASAGPDDKIRLREVASGKTRASFVVPAGLTGLAFAPDGKALALYGGKTGLVLVDPATGKELRRLKPALDPPPRWGDEVVFSPDGKWLAAGGVEKGEGVIRLLEGSSGKETQLVGRAQGSPAFRFSADSSLLAWAAEDGTIRLTRTASGRESKRWAAPDSACHAALSFSPDGKSLASLGYDGAVRIWEPGTDRERTLRSSKRITAPHWLGGSWAGSPGGALAFSPDGKRLAVGLPGLLEVWETAAGVEAFPGHVGPVTGLVVSADGRTATSCGADHTVRRWRLETGEQVGRFSLPVEAFGPVLSPDGRTAVFASETQVLPWWDVTAGRPLRQLRREAAAQGFDGCVGMRDGRELCFSPDGKLLAELSLNGTVHVWEVNSGKKRASLPTFDKATASWHFFDEPPFGRIAFSPDNSLLAVLLPGPGKGMVNLLSLLDLATGNQLMQVPVKRGGTPFAFTPDGRALLLAEPSGGVEVWERASHKVRFRFRPSGAPVVALAGSPSGVLATAHKDGAVCFWDSLTGERLAAYANASGAILGLTFTPDGLRLVSRAADGTALVWAGLRPKAWRGADLAKGEFDRLWQDLASEDAGSAIIAMRRLRSAVPLLGNQLRPVMADDRIVAKWIAKLSAEEFDVREQASRELEKLGDLAGPALKKLVHESSDLEIQRRAGRLLARLERGPLPPEELRRVRAVEILERAGTPPARDLLRVLAGGAEGARLTREARSALARLGER